MEKWLSEGIPSLHVVVEASCSFKQIVQVLLLTQLLILHSFFSALYDEPVHQHPNLHFSSPFADLCLHDGGRAEDKSAQIPDWIIGMPLEDCKNCSYQAFECSKNRLRGQDGIWRGLGMQGYGAWGRISETIIVNVILSTNPSSWRHSQWVRSDGLPNQCHRLCRMEVLQVQTDIRIIPF